MKELSKERLAEINTKIVAALLSIDENAVDIISTCISASPVIIGAMTPDAQREVLDWIDKKSTEHRDAINRRMGHAE